MATGTALQHDVIDGVIKALAERLESKRSDISEEISAYPPPIPACDAQFNYLLEARRGIAGELAQLKDLQAAGLSAADLRKSIERLVEGSSYLDQSAKQALRARLTRAQ